ncbi:MAG: gamma carbonic anhydrase family protein [Panacagrimonas sp.]
MIYGLENRTPTLHPDSFVAPNAVLIGRVTLESLSSVWFNCVVRGDCDDIRIGEGSNVQDGSVLHTDPGIKLHIGKNCTIGHMVMLHGCDIGDGSLIGIKSVVLNGAKIGKSCLVGAGSLVTERKSFPDGVLIMGTPAKVVRELTPEERAALEINAQVYRDNARRYLASFKVIG